MITIQGDMLEGGGQILRLSTALATLIGEPIKIVKVRGKRKPPGLRRQHITALKVLASLCNGKVEGLTVGSTEVFFEPGDMKGGVYTFDVGTAGSVSLILQAAMPVMVFTPSPVELKLRGGTNNPMAPPVDYLERVLFEDLKLMGVEARLKVYRRGFYPRGGGEVEVQTNPSRRLKPLILQQIGRTLEIRGLVYSCRLPNHIAERMALSASERLRSAGLNPVFEKEVLQPENPKCSLDPGCGIILSVKHDYGLFGVDNLGVKGKRAEIVGSEAADQLIELVKGGYPVDRHLCDQLIIWMALADGLSRIKTIELTLHALTCIELTKTILGSEFKIEGSLGKPAVIECKGIGYGR